MSNTKPKRLPGPEPYPHRHTQPEKRKDFWTTIQVSKFIVRKRAGIHKKIRSCNQVRQGKRHT